jgi:dynein heavy chain
VLQIKIKKADNDLLIEQLREVFRVLAADKIPVTKLEKRLDDVTHKWNDVKKLQPQVKGNVEPVQVGLGRTAGMASLWGGISYGQRPLACKYPL